MRKVGETGSGCPLSLLSHLIFEYFATLCNNYSNVKSRVFTSLFARCSLTLIE